MVACQTGHCAQDDEFLAKWTFVRYVVLGSFMTYRFWKLSRKATEAYCATERSPLGAFVGYHPFEEHPLMSMKLATTTWLPIKFFLAGCLFIQSEGVGLAVYFGVSAMMDNFTIFFVHDSCFCKYVTSVALYTMSLASFLPTAAFSYYFQGPLYEDKPWNPIRAHRWYNSKSFFIAAMVLITVLFFIMRLKLIESIGWYATVSDNLDNLEDVKVSFAICVPPMIDFVQSLLLVMAAKMQDHPLSNATEPLLPNTKSNMISQSSTRAPTPDVPGDQRLLSHL